MQPPPDCRKALIFGVSGQDGAYLAHLLLGKGYEVWGTSRHPDSDHPNLRKLGVNDRVKLISCNMLDCAGIPQLLDQAKPCEIYNLAGQTSVSFEQPLETIHSIAHSASIGRDSAEFLVHDDGLLRPTDITYNFADASVIEKALGWTARYTMPDVVRMMLAADAAAPRLSSAG